MFGRQIGWGHQIIAKVLSEIHDLYYSEENGGPFYTIFTDDQRRDQNLKRPFLWKNLICGGS